MNKKTVTRVLALLLAALLCLGLLLPALAAGETDTVYINSAQDLSDFAKSCSYDAWSMGKTVILSRDISLAGVDYLPAASFYGTFEGNNHTISDLNLTSGVAPAGLFGVIGESGVVQNLKVEGVVSPVGTAGQVGGIAGLNRGTIENCTFTGTVEGESSTGGIAGENAAPGLIRNCTVEGGIFGKSRTGGVVGSNSGSVSAGLSRAYVNTNTMDPTISLSDLDLDLRDGLRRLMSPDTYNVATDSGGIAGYSDGMLIRCRNQGSVGYQHIGYNVGGIAGRSSGHISGCTNEGAVYGRRGVGGIVGTAEPNVILDFTENSLEAVREELKDLNAVVEKATRDADGVSDTVSARLETINKGVDTAEDKAKALTDDLTDYWDGTVDEINRGSQIVDEAIDRLKGVTDDLTKASDTLTDALEALERALDILTDEGKRGTSSFDELSAMAEDLRVGSLILDAGLDHISKGLDQLGGIDWAGKAKSGNAGLEEIKRGLRDLEDAMGKVSDALASIGIDFDNGEIELNTDELQDAFDEASDAIGTIGDGVEKFQTLSDKEIDQMDSGLAELRTGLDILSRGRGGDNGGVFTYFSNAMGHLENLTADARAAAAELERAVDILGEASREMTEALRGADSLVAYLQNQDRLTFQNLGPKADPSADALYDSLHDISGNLEQLNQEAKAGSDRLTEDIRAINDQFTRVMDTLLDVVEEVENATASDVLEDTSDEDIDAVINGKVYRSVNTGAVTGDINVGGIAGAMEVYNDANPEGDETKTLSSLFRRRYQLKCVLQECVSSGAVTGKRNHVGAICGDGQLGVISGCEGYGTVESESGDYVGGIVGHADNTVRSSYAKCSLSGRNYIGGIVGGAETEKSGCRVDGCVSLVEIADYTQHAGAIAGMDAGTYTGNRFVSDTLAGLDRISYRDRAEPVDYDALLSLPGLPGEFRTFTLTFLAGEQTVRTLRFRYGDSLDETAFPTIPAREGEYGKWDREDLSDLRFDTTVTAEYFPNVTALPSAITRSAARPVFFAEGGFDDAARLTADPEILTFDPGQEGFWDTLRSYHRTILEQWRVECPDDGSATHTLRYLPPEGGTGSVAVYMSADGGNTWERQETGMAGSYLTFDIPAAGADVTVLSTATPWWVWALVGVLAAGLVALLLTFLIRKKAPAKKVPDAGQEEARLTEEEKARAEAARAKAEKRGKLRKRIRIILLAVVLALAGTVFAILRLAPEVTDSMELYLLLRNYAERPDLHMELDLSTTVEGRAFATKLDLSAGQWEGKRLSCLEWEGIPVYFCDGALILENGRAYGLEDAMPDYAGLLPYVAGIYRSMEVTVTDLGGVKTYHAVTEGEAARDLLGHLFPDDLTALPDTDMVGVDLTLTDGEPTSLTVAWDGAAGSADARLTFLEEPSTREVPQAVRTTLRTGEYQSAPQAGEDLRRLALALTELSAREPLTAETALAANCGPLLLNETLTFQRTRRYGQDLSRVSRRGTGLWFASDRACLDSGAAAGLGEAARLDTGALLRLAYRALLLGETDCTTLAGGYHYILTLDADAMAQFASAIAPETAAMALEFRRGTVTLNIQDGLASALAIHCRGSVHIVQADVPATVSAQITFDKTKPFPEVPQAVVDALELTER